MIKKITLICLLFFMTLLFTDCSSGAKRLDEDKDMVADSGGLTRQELEKAAADTAQKIGLYFKKNPPKQGVFVAMMFTKNNTSDELPTDAFDSAMVRELIKNKIYTLKTDKREDQLKEIKYSQQTGTDLDAGSLKSPNYFVRTVIDEQSIKSGGEKIVEQTLNIELIQVADLVVAYSTKSTYRKQAKSGGVGF